MPKVYRIHWNKTCNWHGSNTGERSGSTSTHPEAKKKSQKIFGMLKSDGKEYKLKWSPETFSAVAPPQVAL